MQRKTALIVLIACLLAGMMAGLVASAFAYRTHAPSKPGAINTFQKRLETTTPKQVPPATPQMTFSVDNAMAHVNYLAGTIGLREEGTAAEQQAAEYIQARMRDYGYAPSMQPVPIETTRRTTHNVIARLNGTVETGRTIVIGAHMDSKIGPGANDNATGCGILLELARILRNNNKQVSTIEFVFFGGEEVAAGGSSNNHHWGSRFFVSTLPQAEKSTIAGMVSVDMVGAGPEFRARNMGMASQVLRDMMLEVGTASGMTYMSDTSSAGMSDHEPFEKSGIPSAWLEYRDFAAYHTTGDTVTTVNVSHVQNVGLVLQDFFESYLTRARLEQMHPQG